MPLEHLHILRLAYIVGKNNIAKKNHYLFKILPFGRILSVKK